MITTDAKYKPLTRTLAEVTIESARDVFKEDAYPQPWEVHLYPDQLAAMQKLKECVFLPTDFQVKLPYPPIKFYGMTVIQDPNFPKDVIEIRDARGKSLAVIRNLG